MPSTYSFPRYLAAKKTLDDRVLNRPVWDTMLQNVRPAVPEQPLRVLEMGCGIGTMLERLLEWGLTTTLPLTEAGLHYTGIDASAENITQAGKRFTQSFAAPPSPLLRTGLPPPTFLLADLFSLPPTLPKASFDLLIAHAFLDLLDIPRALPILFAYLRPGGHFYFTLNFDGETIFQPEHPLDPVILPLYHRTMDERITDGHPSGDSRAGRHLFGHLHHAGAEILAAGSSDWVVFPRAGRYPGDEAYFLHHILHFFEESLTGHSALEATALAEWLATRRGQIDQGELTLIAHQLDFVGKI